MANKNEILRKVINAGLAEDTKPKDRLAIYMKLSELEHSLTKGMGMESDIENQAQEFLRRGLRLIKATSRFIAT